MNPFARLFVFLNRAWGAVSIVVGVALLSMVLLRVLRGLPLADTAWIVVLGAVALIAVGWLYLRAPLSRRTAKSDK
jgi:hypothetical protein